MLNPEPVRIVGGDIDDLKTESGVYVCERFDAETNTVYVGDML